MSHRVYLYPGWLRIWHWLNAILMLTLIATGVSLHYGDPNVPLIRFDLARVIHNIAGIVLTVNYVYYLIGNFVSGNLRHYFPARSEFAARLVRQSIFFVVGSIKGVPPPHVPSEDEKFNILQQLTYLFVMFVALPVLIISGLLFLFPEVAPESFFGMAGLLPIAVTHYVVGFFITLFLLGHVYLGTIGISPTAHFRAMLTGWHVEPEDTGQEREKFFE